MKRYGLIVVYLLISCMPIHAIVGDNTSSTVESSYDRMEESEGGAFEIEHFFDEVADEPEPDADPPMGKTQIKIMQFLSYFAVMYDAVVSKITAYVKK